MPLKHYCLNNYLYLGGVLSKRRKIDHNQSIVLKCSNSHSLDGESNKFSSLWNAWCTSHAFLNSDFVIQILSVVERKRVEKTKILKLLKLYIHNVEEREWYQRILDFKY